VVEFVAQMKFSHGCESIPGMLSRISISMMPECA